MLTLLHLQDELREAGNNDCFTNEETESRGFTGLPTIEQISARQL